MAEHVNKFAHLKPKEDLIGAAARIGGDVVKGATDAVMAIPEQVGLSPKKEDLPQPSNDNAEPEHVNKFAHLKPKEDLGGWGKRVGGAFVRSAGEGFAAVPEAVEIQLKNAQNALGIQGEENIENTGGFQLGQNIRGAIEGVVGKGDPNDHSIETQVASAFGSVVPAIAAGVATGGWGAAAVGAGLGAAQNSAQTFKEARQSGASEADQLKAANIAVPIGLLEGVIGTYVPELKLLPKPVADAVNRGAMRIVTRGITGAAEEGPQEALSQYLNNVNAAIWTGYDPDRGLDQDVAMSAVLGVVVGGTAGMAFGGHGHEDAPKPKVDEIGAKGAGADEKAALAATTAAKPAAPPLATPAEAASGAASGSTVAGIDPDMRAAVETPKDRAIRVSKARDLIRSGRGPIPSTPLPSEEELAAAETAPPVPGAAEPVAPPTGAAGGTIPGADTALGEGVPMPPPGTPLPAAELPTAPEVPAPTPEVTPPAEEATGEAPVDPEATPTVPESPETIAAQRDLLEQGKKVAVLYPAGEVMPPKPEREGIERVNITEQGWMDLDTNEVSVDEAKQMVAEGRLNELLELGPVTKGEAVAREQAGEEPNVTSEINANGVPIRDAANTKPVAEDVAAFMEATKQPGSVIVNRPPAEALQERIDARAPESPATGQEPVQATPIPENPPQPVATPPEPEEGPSEEGGTPIEPDLTPREQKRAKAASKQREKQARGEQRQEGLEKVTSTKYDNIEQQQLDLINKASNAKLSTQSKVAKLKLASISQKLFDGFNFEPNAVSTEKEVRTYLTALKKVVDQMKVEIENLRAQLIEQLPDKNGGISKRTDEILNQVLGEGKRPGSDITVGQVIWMSEAARLSRMLNNKMGEYETFNNFITETQIAKGGDFDALRQRRAEEGQRVGGKGKASVAEREYAESRALVQTSDLGKTIEDELNADALEEAALAEEQDTASDTEAKVPAGKRKAVNVETGATTDTGRTVSVSAEEKARIAAEFNARIAAENAKKGLGLEDNRLAAAEQSLSQSNVLEEKAKATSQKRGQQAQLSKEEIAQKRADEAQRVQQAALGQKTAINEAAAAAEQRAMAQARYEQELQAYWDGVADGTIDLTTTKPPALRERASLQSRVHGPGLVHKPRTKGDEIGAQLEVILGSPDSIVQMETAHNVIDDYVAEQEFSTGNAAVDRFLQPMLEAIRDILPKSTRVVVVRDVDADRIMGKGVKGEYYADADVVLLRQSTNRDLVDGPATLTHEIAHAALQHALDTNPELYAKLEQVIEHVRGALPPRATQRYGLLNPHEFLSEAIGNREFRNELANIRIPKEMYQAWDLPTPSNPRYRTVLNWLREQIARLFGFNLESATALDAALNSIGNLMELAPNARRNFYSEYSQPAGDIFAQGTANPPNTNIHLGPDETKSKAALSREEEKPASMSERMQAAGIPEDWADDFAELIETEFGGEITDEELAKMAAEFSKPIVDVKKDVAAKVAASPERIKPEIAKLADPDPTKPSKRVLAWGLITMPLNTIVKQYGKLFVDSKGVNQLAEWQAALQQREGIVDEYSQPLAKLASELNYYARKDRKQAAKLADLAMQATNYDVRLGPGADNSHLGKDKKKYLQSKRELPRLQKMFDDLKPEAQKIYTDFTEGYRNAHNEANELTVRNMIRDMHLGLSDADTNALINKTVDGTLIRDDMKTFGISEDVFDSLRERSLQRLQGDYFPMMRFGNHVVTTYEDIEKPKLTSVTTKGGKATVPVKTSVDGKVVRFTMDNTTRGSTRALVSAVDDYMLNHHLKTIRRSERWTERGTNKVVKRGEQEIGKDYDLTIEVELQNQGVDYFEKVRDAKAFIKANKARHPSEVLPRKGDLYAKSILEGSNLEALRKRIDGNSELTDFEKSRMKRAMAESLATSLPGNRTPSSYIPRRNVMGFSKDVARAALTYSMAHGNLMANLTLSPKARAAMTAMNQLASERAVNQRPRQQILIELEKRDKLIDEMDPPTGWMQAIAQVSALSKLASPAHSIINATQPVMNSWPQLAGRFGMVRTTAALTSAALRMGIPTNLLRGVWNTAKATAFFAKQHIDFADPLGSVRKKYGPKYKNMFDALVAHGLLDEGASYEVAKTMMTRPGVIKNSLAIADRIQRQLPAVVEIQNRTLTAVAAYDLARRKMSDAQAIQYVLQEVGATQFDYRRFNNARIMMGKHKSWMFQFKTYALGQMAIYVGGIQTVLGHTGATLSERRQAAAQLALTFGVQALVAGVTTSFGTEFLKIAATALGALDGDEDKWDEWKGVINKAVADGAEAVLGKENGEWWGQLLQEGIVSRVTGIDIQSRMSMSDLLTGFGPKEMDGDGISAYLWNLFGGAPGGMISGWFEGGAKWREGKIDEALTKWVPLKVLADYFKAEGAKKEGGYSPQQEALQIIGFKSSDETKKTEKTAGKWDRYNADNAEKKALYDAYNNAKTPGERAKVVSRIRAWNRSLKSKGVKDINIGGLEPYRRAREREKRLGKDPEILQLE